MPWRLWCHDRSFTRPPDEARHRERRSMSGSAGPRERRGHRPHALQPPPRCRRHAEEGGAGGREWTCSACLLWPEVPPVRRRAGRAREDRDTAEQGYQGRRGSAGLRSCCILIEPARSVGGTLTTGCNRRLTALYLYWYGVPWE